MCYLLIPDMVDMEATRNSLNVCEENVCAVYDGCYERSATVCLWKRSIKLH